MTLSKFNLPSTVLVEGKHYEIHTDFQYFLTLTNLIKKNQNKEFDLSFIFKNNVPKNKQEALYALLQFAYPKRELPKVEETSDDILLDYEKDAELIYSAFYECYGIDLFETKLHWHKFQALLFGLENTRLNKVMEYRSYKPTAKESSEMKAQNSKLKRMWTIEEELTDEEQAVVDKFDSLFK